MHVLAISVIIYMHYTTKIYSLKMFLEDGAITVNLQVIHRQKHWGKKVSQKSKTCTCIT